MAGNPTSMLTIQCRILSTNLSLGSMDTPQRWLPTPPLYTGWGNGLGATWDQLFQQRRGGGTNGNRDEATQGDGGGQDGSSKQQYSNVQIQNQDIQPLLDLVIKPILDRKLPSRLNDLCKLAELDSLRILPRCNNMCFRWMLVTCDPKDGNNSRCKVQTENLHPPVVKVPDNYAA